MSSGWNLSHTIFHGHDLRFVALAMVICALGSLTAIAVAHHALKPEAATWRRGWLLLTGLVTGLAVWTTHFTAMLGYRNDLDIRYDLASAAISLLLAIALSMTAWVWGFVTRERGIRAGIIIGIGIALAHFIDMQALRVAGSIHHNHLASLAAIALGLGLGGWSGHLFGRWQREVLAWPAVIVLAAAILTLHFVAMSGVSVSAGTMPLEVPHWSATSAQLAAIVVVAFLFLLAAAIVTTWQSARIARASADKQVRLIEALEVAETALRDSEERYRFASRAANEVIWDWSFEKQSASWAGAYMKMLGYTELDESTGLEWWVSRIHPDDVKCVLANQATALESGDEYWTEEYRFLVASGDWIDVKSSCLIVRNEAGETVRLVGSMLDITEQKKAQSELNWAAYHDPLTGLPNRALYRTRMASAIDAAKEAGRSVALVLLDLNRFKELNDTLGHAAGDEVLQEIARRLSSSVPEAATVARLGGDEFAIILPDLPTAEAYHELVQGFSQSLLDPVATAEMRIPIGYCAGVAICPRDGADPGGLLIAADLALYAAKAEAPGTIFEFAPFLRADAERRSRMLAIARTALEDDAILPFYQPKIDLQTGRITGWEALLRIEAADGQTLLPSDIEAAFADAELTVRITDRMFSRVFGDIARWRSAGIDPGRIAVNVSAGDFRKNGLVKRLQFHAGAHRQELSGIEIEVTENVLIGRMGPEVSRTVAELQAVGVRVSLDDFGTGYASLTHLQKLPVDVIKIDKSFIERIGSDQPHATVVIDAVLQMARQLGMKTVAEGIETLEQARYLRARGCCSGQGFLFSPAVAFADVETVLTGEPAPGWPFTLALREAEKRRCRGR